MPDSQPQPPPTRPEPPRRQPPRCCSAAPGSPTAAPSTYGSAAAASRPSAPQAASPPPRRRAWTSSGYLLLPAPAEPHAHGDTALTADSHGPVSYDPEDVQRRATEAALLQLGHGATALRSHVRIGDVQGLGPLEAVLQARRSLRGLADLTAVAVPRLLTGRGRGRRARDAAGRGEDGRRRGRRLPGPRPRPDRLRGGRPGGRRRARLPRRPAHRRRRPGPARPARGDGRAGCGPASPSARARGLARLPARGGPRAADQLAAAGCHGGLPAAGRLRGRRNGRGTAPVRLLRAAGVRVAAGSGALRDVVEPGGPRRPAGGRVPAGLAGRAAAARTRTRR